MGPIGTARIKIETEVVCCGEVFKDIYKSGVGPDAVFEKASLGFYINFKHSHELLFVGYERPALNSGDKVSIIIQKEP